MLKRKRKFLKELGKRKLAIVCVNAEQVDTLKELLLDYDFSINYDQQTLDIRQIKQLLHTYPVFFLIILHETTFSVQKSNIIDILRIHMEKDGLTMNYVDFMERYVKEYGYIDKPH